MFEIIYGLNTIEQAIIKNQVIKLYSDLDNNHPLIKLANHKRIKIMPLAEFSDFSRYRELNFQKAIAEIKPFKYYGVEEVLKNHPSFVLILDQIKDPYNLGAIIRSAVAFGVEYIIVPKNNIAPITPIVHKTSVGASFDIKIVQATSFVNLLKRFKKEGYWIATAAMDGDTSLEQLKKDNLDLVFILGSEGDGVRKTLVKNSDFIVKIPISDKVESLNVSVANGIILYTLTKK